MLTEVIHPGSAAAVLRVLENAREGDWLRVVYTENGLPGLPAILGEVTFGFRLSSDERRAGILSLEKGTWKNSLDNMKKRTFEVEVGPEFRREAFAEAVWRYIEEIVIVQKKE